MVLDFGELKKEIQADVIDLMDHQDLNIFIDNPTAENICDYIWDRLDKRLGVKLIEIRLRETPECEVIYKGGVN